MATQFPKAIEILLDALKTQKPVVLFAGQAFGSGEEDFVLQSALDKLQIVPLPKSSWRDLFGNGPLHPEIYGWLSERFERNVYPEETQAVLGLSWSAVFTTSIDNTLSRRIETHGRRPEQVLARDHFARVPRSRSRPPIYYLFGKANEVMADTRPPQSRADLKRRISSHANDFLNRLPDTITGNGILIISGFLETNDWLPVDELLAPLSTAVGIKTVWFGLKELPQSDFAQEMIDNGSLILVTEQLSSFMPLLDEFIATDIHKMDEPGVVSLSGGKFLDLEPSMRLRVEASATIIDDAWTDSPEGVGNDVDAGFRRFHGGLGGLRGTIDGLLRGFAIERDFEEKLRKRVSITADTSNEVGNVVILHGQSGTGKTIALANLAIHLRLTAKVPVLFSSFRVPPAADIDAFCSDAERAGAAATIVIIDANQSINRYRDLASQLVSRGRRVIIVGSSYRLDVELHDRRFQQQLIEAETTMSEKEQQLLRNLVTKFKASSVLEEINDDISTTNSLAMLYRNLSAGRGRIVTGVTQEARQVEERIRERAVSIPVERGESAIAEALIRAQKHSGTVEIFDESSENEQFAAIGRDAAGRLIDYVMSAARVDCPVPLNLLMRVLRAKHSALNPEQIMYLFRDLDLFRWREVGEEGADYAITSRIQLEAELICRRRLADTSKELECLIDLIKGVQAIGVDKSSERQFLLDLLHKLDRDGPRGDAYSFGYKDIGDALRTLRTSKSVIDASLMLQEAFFWRRAIWANDGPKSSGILSEEERYRILNDARETVELALKLIDEGKLRASNRIKQNFKVERASIYGYLAVQNSLQETNFEKTWSSYLAAREASKQAMAMAQSYHPIDVALWTPKDILASAELPEAFRAELLADIYSTLDQIQEEDLTSDQKIKYFERRSGLATILRDNELASDAIARLQEIAPASAAYLIARNLAEGVLEVKTNYNVDERRIAAKAADYLMLQRADGISDERCQRLYMRLRWIESTGEGLLSTPRGKTPASASVISDLLGVVTRLNQDAGLNVRPADRYIEAVLAWLSRDIARAEEIWQALSHDTEYEDRSRVVRRLVATDSDGLPKLFRGSIQGTKRTNEDHWKLRVDGIPGNIILLHRDFPNEDLRPGRELWDFAVAFNYIGPIADPVVKVIKK